MDTYNFWDIWNTSIFAPDPKAARICQPLLERMRVPFLLIELFPYKSGLYKKKPQKTQKDDCHVAM